VSNHYLMILLGVLFLGCGDAADSDPIMMEVAEDAGTFVDDQGLADDDAEGSRPDAMPAEDAAVVTSDAGVFADATSRADAGPVMPDQGVMPPEGPPPTWVDCHLAARDGELVASTLAQCDELHTSPPEERIYGVRFVFLSDPGDLMDWIQPRLDAANRIFEPAGISFTLAAIVEVLDGEVEYLTGSQSLTLGERLGDLRGHLEMPDAEIAGLLETLRERLLSSGADPTVASALSPETAFTDQLFMRLMARAHPEDIYVAVGTVSERPGAGGQAPPPFHPIPTLERSVVSVRAGTKNTVAAHELGHYFGLKHPHSHSAGGPNSHLFGFRRVQNSYRARDTHQLMEVVDEHFGPDLSGPVGTPFIPYDASVDEISDFEALRFALMDTWVRWRVTHTGDLQPYGTYSDFIQAWRRGDQISMSNYMFMEGERNMNNCTWQNEERAFRCIYPDEESPLEGNAPLLDGYILFDDGTKSNVMSYIRIQGPNSPATNYGLFDEQVDVIRVSANAPQRLALRNYALETE